MDMARLERRAREIHAGMANFGEPSWDELDAANDNHMRGRAEAILQAMCELVPVRMLLFCPQCGTQHVDAPDPARNWSNPPHRSHECQHCLHVWRPADVATTGVALLRSRGQRDGSPVPGQAAQSALEMSGQE